MNWKATYNCSPGVFHQKKGISCQDYANYHLLESRVIIGAVADGAGTARYADTGAKLAVDTILNYLQQFHEQFLPTSVQSPKTVAEERFSHALTQEVIPALQQAAQQRNCSLQELACTLIAFVATPNWIAAMQVGDGFLVIRLNDGEYQLLLQPDKGEFVNETTFITTQQASAALNVKILQGNMQFICASTDGLETVALRLSDWTPHPPFFKPLEAYLEQTDNPDKDKEYLEKFLNSERLNSRTDDDKTLLLCLYDAV
ncbi:MAG: protein phosphatase 2C domain-containing protein [Symploca sp. SIO3E6]|nr:protein phosphatase 2C domain-containing protein [Caldora sp. SIO3E6]